MSVAKKKKLTKAEILRDQVMDRIEALSLGCDWKVEKPFFGDPEPGFRDYTVTYTSKKNDALITLNAMCKDKVGYVMVSARPLRHFKNDEEHFHSEYECKVPARFLSAAVANAVKWVQTLSELELPFDEQ